MLYVFIIIISHYINILTGAKRKVQSELRRNAGSFRKISLFEIY